MHLTHAMIVFKTEIILRVELYFNVQGVSEASALPKVRDSEWSQHAMRENAFSSYIALHYYYALHWPSVQANC